MSEDSPILLPAPAPGGEPFEAFYQRAVVGDDDRSSLARAARYFGLDLMLHATLRPEAFTPSRFKELHDGLAVLPLGTNPDRFLRLADHLWFSANADNLPLDIRMIPHQGARLDPLPAVQPDAVAEERVAIWRRAARRRDGLLVALCEALRQGVYICEGFLAADARRQKVSIPADWWADRDISDIASQGRDGSGRRRSALSRDEDHAGGGRAPPVALAEGGCGAQAQRVVAQDVYPSLARSRPFAKPR